MLDRLATLSAIVGIVCAVWVFWPAFRCTGRSMTGAQVGGFSEGGFRGNQVESAGDRAARTADVARVQNANGFLSRFFGSIGVCFGNYPLRTADPIPLYGFLGGLGGAFVLSRFARAIGPGQKT